MKVTTRNWSQVILKSILSVTVFLKIKVFHQDLNKLTLLHRIWLNLWIKHLQWDLKIGVFSVLWWRSIQIKAFLMRIGLQLIEFHLLLWNLHHKATIRTWWLNQLIQPISQDKIKMKEINLKILSLEFKFTQQIWLWSFKGRNKVIKARMMRKKCSNLFSPFNLDVMLLKNKLLKTTASNKIHNSRVKYKKVLTICHKKQNK